MMFSAPLPTRSMFAHALSLSPQAERRDMERQFESAKFDLARKLLVEKVSRVCRGFALV